MSATGGGGWPVAVLTASLAALAGSLIAAVRVDGAAREAIAAADSLREELRSAREQLSREVRRADSLSSRRRVRRAAGRMGFRLPDDTAVRFLPELQRGADGGRENRTRGGAP